MRNIKEFKNFIPREIFLKEREKMDEVLKNFIIGIVIINLIIAPLTFSYFQESFKVDKNSENHLVEKKESGLSTQIKGWIGFLDEFSLVGEIAKNKGKIYIEKSEIEKIEKDINIKSIKINDKGTAEVIVGGLK